jgi:hypothetical protein
MKTWNSYGSEHSANLVMIGKFIDVASAEAAKHAIDEIEKFVGDQDSREGAERYTDAEMDLFKRLNFYWLQPGELEQFRYDIRSELQADSIVVTTDETEIAALLKLLLAKGARVEVYSAHDYPNTGKGR